jgi:hypothetical protein
VLRNPTTGASIGEPRAFAYTSCIAYVSYTRVYHLFTPSTLTIDRVTSCRLLKYIHSAATIPRLVTGIVLDNKINSIKIFKVKMPSVKRFSREKIKLKEFLTQIKLKIRYKGIKLPIVID